MPSKTIVISRKYPKRSAAAVKLQAAYRRKAKRAPVKAITNNNNRIKKLEKSVNGHVQIAYHGVKFSNDVGTFRLSAATPLLINAINFTEKNDGGGHIYFPIYTGVSPSIVTAPATAAQWDNLLPGQLLGLDQRYHMWDDQNLNTVSKVAYQPISCDFKFNFSVPAMPATEPDMWFRIDHFKTKRQYLTSVYHDYSMPNSLGSLQNMAVDDVLTRRNRFNPALFKIVKTRYVKLKKVETAVNDYNVTVNIPIRFGKKLMKLNLDNPSPGITEPFYLGTDPKDAEWVMVSVSDTLLNPRVALSRVIKWRDQHGIQM